MAKKKSKKGAAKNSGKKPKSLLAEIKRVMPHMNITPLSQSPAARSTDSAAVDTPETLPGASVAAYLKDAGTTSAADAIDALSAAESGAHDEQVEVFLASSPQPSAQGAPGPGPKVAIASQSKGPKGVEG